MTSDGAFDITVIGSGPGGYVAAIRAAQLGLRAAVVEMAPLPGGTCLHSGCIPTKALLQAAETLDGAHEAARFGVTIPSADVDLPSLNEYKERIVQSNAKGIQYLLKKNGITAFAGRGRVAAPGRVEVTRPDAPPAIIETRAIVLATGSTVRALPGIEFDGDRIISSDDAVGMARLPASIVVLGAGAVGVEFASIYASFGAQVTLVELLPRLLPLEDADLGAELQKAFRARKIAVHTNTRVEEVDLDGDGVRITASTDGEPLGLEAETLLVAVGRAPRTDDPRPRRRRRPSERRLRRGRRDDADRPAGNLRHRRHRQHAHAGPRRLARGHRGRGARRWQPAATAQLRQGPLLHLLRPRGRLRRPLRGGGRAAADTMSPWAPSPSPPSPRRKSSTTRAAS